MILSSQEAMRTPYLLKLNYKKKKKEKELTNIRESIYQ